MSVHTKTLPNQANKDRISMPLGILITIIKLPIDYLMQLLIFRSGYSRFLNLPALEEGCLEVFFPRRFIGKEYTRNSWETLLFSFQLLLCDRKRFISNIFDIFLFYSSKKAKLITSVLCLSRFQFVWRSERLMATRRQQQRCPANRTANGKSRPQPRTRPQPSSSKRPVNRHQRQ